MRTCITDIWGVNVSEVCVFKCVRECASQCIIFNNTVCIYLYEDQIPAILCPICICISFLNISNQYVYMESNAYDQYVLVK